MKTRPFRLLTISLLVTFLLAPVTIQAAELAKKQNLKLGLPVRDIRTLDPAHSTLTGEKSVVGQMFNGLLRTP